ncbi:MAG: DUF4493 domain-containing protein [Alistipes senegalensis]
MKRTRGGGCGTIRIACRTDLSIDAEAKASPKATRTEITAPDGSEFALRITGADFDRSSEGVAAFEAEENVFAEGAYKIAVEHGDPQTEGPDKPYFSGSNRHRRSGPPRQHRPSDGPCRQIADLRPDYGGFR